MTIGRYVDLPADQISPDEAATVYAKEIAQVVDTLGEERVLAETDLDQASVTALRDGRADAIELTGVSRILALLEEVPAETVKAELLDGLLIEMTNAVIDVERLAIRCPLGLSAKEIQQRIEGREPMSLEVYAVIRETIIAERP